MHTTYTMSYSTIEVGISGAAKVAPVGKKGPRQTDIFNNDNNTHTHTHVGRGTFPGISLHLAFATLYLKCIVMLIMRRLDSN